MSLTSLLGMNKTEESTDKIVTAIDNNKSVIEQPVVIVNEETNDNELKAISDKLDDMEEKMNEVSDEARETEPEVIIVEKEVEVPVYKSTNNVSNNNTTYLDRPFEEGVIKCEVCEQGGGELETWYDSNNVKHITHTNKCTQGIDSLYNH
jgi:hypothetical protein